MTALTKETVRLAAVGDLHCPKTSEEVLAALLLYANDRADIFCSAVISRTMENRKSFDLGEALGPRQDSNAGGAGQPRL